MSEYLKSRKRLNKLQKEVISDTTMNKQLFILETLMESLHRKLNCSVQHESHPAGKFTPEDAKDLHIYKALYTILKTLKEQMNEKDLLEKLSALEHEQWTDWTRNLDKQQKCQSPHGHIIFNRKKWNRWLGQAATPYENLSETEKASDRYFARKVLELLSKEGVLL